jgi:hypothetical protein
LLSRAGERREECSIDVFHVLQEDIPRQRERTELLFNFPKKDDMVLAYETRASGVKPRIGYVGAVGRGGESRAEETVAGEGKYGRERQRQLKSNGYGKREGNGGSRVTPGF